MMDGGVIFQLARRLSRRVLECLLFGRAMIDYSFPRDVSGGDGSPSPAI